MPITKSVTGSGVQPRDHLRLIPCLRVVDGPLYRAGRSPQFTLPLDYKRFVVIGRAESCDWTLLHETVSRQAVIVTRAGLCDVLVTKHENGRPPKVGRRPFDAEAFGPAEVFRLGEVYVMVFNRAMLQARPRVAWWLGIQADRDRVIDTLLAKVTVGASILILGDATLWPDRLAEYLHDNLALFAQGPLVPLPANLRDGQLAEYMARCQGAGALIRVSDNPSPREKQQVRRVAATLRARNVPVYVTARDIEVAQAALEEQRVSFHEVPITPLNRRDGELEVLFAGMATWLSVPFHDEVFAPNLTRLERYDWPKNFTELAEVTAIIGAIAKGSLTKAAKHQELPRSTYRYQLKKYRLVRPATAPTGCARSPVNQDDEPTWPGGGVDDDHSGSDHTATAAAPAQHGDAKGDA